MLLLRAACRQYAAHITSGFAPKRKRSGMLEYQPSALESLLPDLRGKLQVATIERDGASAVRRKRKAIAPAVPPLRRCAAMELTLPQETRPPPPPPPPPLSWRRGV